MFNVLQSESGTQSIVCGAEPGPGETVDQRQPWKLDAILFGLALCAVPVSIAIAESLLGLSLLVRLAKSRSRRVRITLPRVFWFWLIWAGLEILVWLKSSAFQAGQGEMRHLLLIAALFVQVSVLERASDQVAIWRWIVVSATVSSIVLIWQFVSRFFFYRGNLPPIIYLRGGGLLHHWMIYALIEILVFTGLLQLWHFYREERWWLLPAMSINAMAIVLSLTRMLWICCLLVLVIHLTWLRSRWVFAVPVFPCVLFLVTPGVIRSRVTDSFRRDYYPNAERVQMAEVGWRMVRERPITGIGPGRVQELYTAYLTPAEPVPAYHGHLHNNLIQLAAEFGVPVAAAATIFLVILFRELRRRRESAKNRDEQFLYSTAMLGLAGFVASSVFDYTYGHSLGLILLGFTVLTPLVAEKKPCRHSVIESRFHSDGGEGAPFRSAVPSGSSLRKPV